jgi:hypothetical protein
VVYNLQKWYIYAVVCFLHATQPSNSDNISALEDNQVQLNDLELIIIDDIVPV